MSDMSDVSDVTPYDRLRWPPAVVEELLRSGAESELLRAYFGDAAYGELVALAREIDPASIRHDDRVYVLPGIMGSQLGCPRAPPLPDDVIWFDPIDFRSGGILALRLAAGSSVRPLGVLLPDYMHLFLRLRVAGFDALLYDYDWRLGVDVLGAALARRLAADPAPRISMVAHSLGGLVARAALAAAPPRVARVVTVGTPHGGSFAPVQAFRGTYPVVRRIASLDPVHSAEELATGVFSGFPSLYDLLPHPGPGCEVDLFEPRNWPTQGPRPDFQLLAAARSLPGKLAAADERFRIVAATGEPTVTGIERERDEFRYRSNLVGDGTVPLAYACLEGVPTRFVSGVRHGDLAKHGPVIEAVCELLETGDTEKLDSAPTFPTLSLTSITDAELRRTALAKIDWATLTPLERTRFLDTLSAPPAAP